MNLFAVNAAKALSILLNQSSSLIPNLRRILIPIAVLVSGNVASAIATSTFQANQGDIYEMIGYNHGAVAVGDDGAFNRKEVLTSPSGSSYTCEVTQVSVSGPDTIREVTLNEAGTWTLMRYIGAGDGNHITMVIIKVAAVAQVDPTISISPGSATINEGGSTTFVATATGDPDATQWQESNGSGWSAISSGTLTNVPYSKNGYLYRCVATKGNTSVASNEATLTVTKIPFDPVVSAPTITFTPSTATVDISNGAASVVLAVNVKVDITNGDSFTSLSVSPSTDLVSAGSGANQTFTYSPPANTADGTKITFTASCVTAKFPSGAVNNPTATITVINQPPTQPPVSQTVTFSANNPNPKPGETVTFTLGGCLSTTGYTLTSDPGLIGFPTSESSGTTDFQYTIPQGASAKTYRVTAGALNDATHTSSAPVPVDLNVIAGPTSQTVTVSSNTNNPAPGDTVVFTVSGIKSANGYTISADNTISGLPSSEPSAVTSFSGKIPVGATSGSVYSVSIATVKDPNYTDSSNSVSFTIADPSKTSQNVNISADKTSPKPGETVTFTVTGVETPNGYNITTDNAITALPSSEPKNITSFAGTIPPSASPGDVFNISVSTVPDVLYSSGSGSVRLIVDTPTPPPALPASVTASISYPPYVCTLSPIAYSFTASASNISNPSYQFTIDSSIPVNNGSNAVYSTNSLAPGSHTLTITVSGKDSNDNPTSATSTPQDFTVVAVPKIPSITLTLGSGESYFRKTGSALINYTIAPNP